LKVVMYKVEKLGSILNYHFWSFVSAKVALGVTERSSACNIKSLFGNRVTTSTSNLLQTVTV
jgi:hypothetical protein